MNRILIILFLFTSFLLHGQFPATNEHYILNPILINPAHAGRSEAFNLASYFHRQWAGVKGSPETFTLAADSPFLNEDMGLGLIMKNDRLGVTNETKISANYAYKIDFNAGLLSFGIGAGFLANQSSWSDLVTLDEEDSKYLTDSRLNIIPDFSFGLHFSYQEFFFDFSMPQLVKNNLDQDEMVYYFPDDLLKYNYSLMAGYTFKVGENFDLMPGAFIITTPNDFFLYDINIYTSFFNRFWTGISYRSNQSLNGLFQFHVNESFILAYTYDFNIGQISSYSSGSHGLMLKFVFGGKFDVASPLEF